ncbi:MAG TPA: hypothetical protein VKS19_03445, partial [Verrucomicrobiae bacterium]|nr:hypothetical protein [Verrucomicrobiae bacterium]
ASGLLNDVTLLSEQQLDGVADKRLVIYNQYASRLSSALVHQSERRHISCQFSTFLTTEKDADRQAISTEANEGNKDGNEWFTTSHPEFQNPHSTCSVRFVTSCSKFDPGFSRILRIPRCEFGTPHFRRAPLTC